jgi:cobalamin biosynthesis protein CobT
MARRRTLNYREMRADFDEDEDRREEEEGDEDEDDEEDEEEGGGEAEPEGDEESEDEGDEEEAPVKKKKPKAKPKRTRTVKTTRKRVVWVVYNNSHQPVATYDYPKKAEAQAHAERLMAEKKSTFFIQPVKEDIEEKKEK